MGAYSFTYNSFTPGSGNGCSYDGKHELTIEDGTLVFRQPFVVLADPAAGTEAQIDESLKNRLGAVLAALQVDNANFVFKLGTETLLSWSHAANTGFLTRARVSQSAEPKNTGRSQRVTFEVRAQREPQQSGRAGRREGKLSIGYSTDRLRSVVIEGVWTAITAGPATAALANYLGSITAWVDTWIGSGGLLAPVSGASWQFIEEPMVAVDDENKVLAFRLSYAETYFSSAPSNVADAIYTLCQITRVDPQMFGAKLNGGGAAAGGSDSEANPLSHKTVVGGGGSSEQTATTQTAFPRYSVNTTTSLTNRTTNANTFFNSTVRAWITSTINAIFGAGRVVFESVSVPISDVLRKTVQCTAVCIKAPTGALISYSEELVRKNNRGLVDEVIWSGQPDDFDLAESGRRLTVIQIVKQERLDQPCADPPFLSEPYQFLDEELPTSAVVVDPMTQRILKYQASHTRRYLYAPRKSRSGAAALTPAPLGRNSSGGSRGFVPTPSSSDNGTNPPLR